ncbi:hypothetical protein ES705_23356 [subsurface metagenome]
MKRKKNAFKTKIGIIDPAIILQVITNIRNPLDLLREQIANICAPEVGAKNVTIKYYDNIGQYGTSFFFEDDGRGMNFAGNQESGELDPLNGRLDKFLTLGASGIVGIPSDYYGWKGLGSKLSLNCKEVSIRTKTSAGENYRIEFKNPRGQLFEKRQVPECTITSVDDELPHKPTSGTGTHIMVLGYAGGETGFGKNEIIEYLRQWTLCGCTQKQLTLPKFSFQYNKLPLEELHPGYKFITEEDRDGLKNEDRWNTIIMKHPIKITKQVKNEDRKVTVVLKGGFSYHTSKFGFPKRTGLVLSVKGIPYFSLYVRHYTPDTLLDVNPKNCRFVVECDDFLEYDTLDMARSTYKKDSIGKTFDRALEEAFEQFCMLSDYKEFEVLREEKNIEKLADDLKKRMDTINLPSQEFVFVEGMTDAIHRKPENEKDTLAILWKLEGMQKKLPFYYFRSLEHANKEGIDLLIKIRETSRSEEKRCSAEIKYIFNARYYNHEPSQANIIFCWQVTPSSKLRESEQYKFKYYAKLGDEELWIYEISSFPSIKIQTLEK